MEQIVRWTERVLALIGTACLIWVSSVSIYAVVYQQTQNTLLDGMARTPEPPDDERSPTGTPPPPEPAGPIGRLEIPRVGLSVIVVEGDDERTLDVAVGHLPDTPLPWQDGKAAFAGHRNTFFRPLRRIHVGDDIRLETRHGTFRYRVTRWTVVDPNDLRVLEPSPLEALTLITCYPFDFLGAAPRRFVVHAARVASAHDSSHRSTARGADAA
jgi:sortase A